MKLIAICACGQASIGQQPARIYTSSLGLSKMERNALAQKLEKEKEKKEEKRKREKEKKRKKNMCLNV